jgi:hypothetical protein
MVLSWMFNNQIKDVESVGKVVSEYYRDHQKILDIISKGGNYSQV